MAADVFAGHVVLTLRRDVVPLLRIVASRDGSETAIDVHPGIPGGSIELTHNVDYDATSVIVAVSSYTEPTAWYSRRPGHRRAHARSSGRRCRATTPTGYVSERLTCPARTVSSSR